MTRARDLAAFVSNADGDIKFDTDTLFIDSSANSVGIGTSTPTAYGNGQSTLVVEDSSNPAIAISDTGQARDWFLVALGDGLGIRYADGGGSGSASNIIQSAFFKNDGNLGIGTSDPHDSGDNFSMLTLNGAKGGGIVFSDDDVNQHQIYTTDDNSLRFARGSGLSDESMRIDSSGNVGLAGSPTSVGTGHTTLNLKGNSSSQPDRSGAIRFERQDGTQAMYIAHSDGDNRIAGISTYPLTFRTNNTERMRILADGGLTFNGDTAAANALDDYEEGLHSPTLTGGTSGSVSMRSGYQQLSYQVIGNRCTMTGRWEVSGGHNLVGNVRISLPFATANLTDQAGVGVGTIFLHRTGTDFDQGVVFGLVAFEGESNAYIYYQTAGTGNESLVQGSQLDSNFEGFLNISFPIA